MNELLDACEAAVLAETNIDHGDRQLAHALFLLGVCVNHHRPGLAQRMVDVLAPDPSDEIHSF